MIAETLSFLADLVVAELRQRYGAGSRLVWLAAPGAKINGVDEGAHLSLVNLEREGVAPNSAQTARRAGDGFALSRQPLNLNLVFMVSINYPDAYAKSLRMLADVVALFQRTPVMTPQTGDLPKGLARLSVEWRDIDLHAIHSIWTSLGSPYLPSAIYLARTLTMDDAGLAGTAPKITSVGLEK